MVKYVLSKIINNFRGQIIQKKRLLIRIKKMIKYYNIDW